VVAGVGDENDQAVVDRLSEAFCRVSGLAPPVERPREVQRRWTQPLRAVLALVDGDEARAGRLLGAAVEHLRKGGCVIVDPGSVERTARGLAGRAPGAKDPLRYVQGMAAGRVRH